MEQTNTLKMGSIHRRTAQKPGADPGAAGGAGGSERPGGEQVGDRRLLPGRGAAVPLARALNTTVDALLQFEAALTDEEVARQINALMETLPQKGADACEEELRRLVCRWPGCTALQFNAAMVCDGFEMFFPDAQPEPEGPLAHPQEGTAGAGCAPRARRPTGRRPPSSWPVWRWHRTTRTGPKPCWTSCPSTRGTPPPCGRFCTASAGRSKRPKSCFRRSFTRR